MVQSLMSTLMEGQKTVGTVTGDTKIFGDKEMGRAPTGENLSTYRELCSLASDMNQPDLGTIHILRKHLYSTKLNLPS